MFKQCSITICYFTGSHHDFFIMNFSTICSQFESGKYGTGWQWRIQKILVGRDHLKNSDAQNLKNSDVFTKIESDFSAEIGNSNVFFAQIQVVSKKKKVFTKIESDFSAEIGNSNVFFAQIQVVSKKKKKKKKKVFTKIETDFSPD